MKKDILTTGDVARICKVAPRTVTKWFDSGQLKGYRIPGGRDRRIPRAELIRFMKLHNMVLPDELDGKIKVLIVSDDSDITPSIATVLKDKGYDVETAETDYVAGLKIQGFAPNVILMNLSALEIGARKICETIKANKEFSHIMIIACGGQLNNAGADALLKQGFDRYVPDFADSAEVIKKITEVIESNCTG